MCKLFPVSVCTKNKIYTIKNIGDSELYFIMKKTLILRIPTKFSTKYFPFHKLSCCAAQMNTLGRLKVEIRIINLKTNNLVYNQPEGF